MMLRNCALLKSWPPIWSRTEGTGESQLSGEIGTLNSVSISRVEPFTTCYLMMDLDGTSYIGTLYFDNPSICRQVFDLLQRRDGLSIQQIGDLALA